MGKNDRLVLASKDMPFPIWFSFYNDIWPFKSDLHHWPTKVRLSKLLHTIILQSAQFYRIIERRGRVNWCTNISNSQKRLEAIWLFLLKYHHNLLDSYVYFIHIFLTVSLQLISGSFNDRICSQLLYSTICWQMKYTNAATFARWISAIWTHLKTKTILLVSQLWIEQTKYQ